ncbi:MAG: 30S ribosomal protein S21 [Candidatus Brennerbacteria bacterium]|nr:30S ribosomal protein S21 [Candidatus Brennerbacteria bacterium]
MELHKKEGENLSGLLYRFNKKMQHSGILKEAKKRRFYKRVINRNKIKAAALYRSEKMKEIQKARKIGASF